jgi:hypothetical protein
MEVFILGYPFTIELPAYPVLKRGSIASEPKLFRFVKDYLLVDTASRPGMSGAPVIRRSWTNHMVQPGVVALVDTPLNKFIGVYSGRAPTDHPHEAQICVGWLPHRRSHCRHGEGRTTTEWLDIMRRRGTAGPAQRGQAELGRHRPRGPPPDSPAPCSGTATAYANLSALVRLMVLSAALMMIGAVLIGADWVYNRYRRRLGRRRLNRDCRHLGRAQHARHCGLRGEHRGRA